MSGYRWVRLYSLVLAGTLLMSSVAMAETLRIAAADWPPYFDRERPEQGLAAEIVKTVFTQAGYEVEFHMLNSWDRVREGVEVGVYDVVAGFWRNEERERFLAYSEPYLVNRIRLVVRKGSRIKFDKREDLSGRIVATVHNFAYQEMLDQDPTIIQLRENHVIQALLKLVAGEAEIAVGDETVLQHEIVSYMASRQGELKMLETPLVEYPLYVSVSLYHSERDEILKRFNDALAALKAEGAIESIRQRHLELEVKAR